MPKRFFSLFVVCFLLFSAFSLSVNADNDRFVECRTVKIGYFEFPGYQEISETGEKSGYGYEYLQELRKYANWKYEYVYADYGKCLELLKNGEIDLLTSVSYSDAREEIYDYSAASMGTKDTIMTVKSTNSKYIPGEYNSFDGIHIGMLKENTNDKNLEKFSKLHEFSYTKDDSFADIDSLKQALQTGEIDAIITSNLRIIENETIIAEFSPSPYYAIVKGGNKELLYELNNAMEKINIITPTYQTTLYQKYYGSTHVGSISFSSDELEYIKNNPKLTILVPPSLCPMAYVENGKVKGIEPDLIRKALEPSGFIIDFITFDSADEYIKVREQTDKYPVLALVNDNLYNAEISDVRLTSPYVNITYTIVTKVGAPKDNIIVAAVKKEPLVLNYVEKHYKPEQIRYYDNGNECIEAILNGQATHTVMNSYIAEHIIENDLQNRLVSSAIMGFSTNFSISVHNSTDYSLFSILNKCVTSMSLEDSRTILMKNTFYKEAPISFIEYLYMYPARIIAFIVLFFAVLITIIIIAANQQRIKKEQRLFEETSHFAKIATEANGDISEYNVNDGTITLYTFVDNKLVKKKSSISADTFNNMTRSELIAPDNLDEYNEFISRDNVLSLAGKDIEKSCTIKMKSQNGKYYWTYMTLQGIQSDLAHPNNIMIFKKNVDVVKRKEEQNKQELTDALNTAKAASEAKGAFMSRMSHEIRTPLNAVIGYMTIAKNNNNNLEKIKDCINKAEIAAKHLLSIINDVLDMSSIESGKLKVAKSSFDIRELVSNASAVFYMQSMTRNVKFETITKGIENDFLIGDKLRVNQILLNLLSNAVKFTSEGGEVFFTVEQTGINNNTVFIKFTVSDTGIGMTKEFRDRLFMPFEQQDSSIAQNFGGTGIGLSITKNLVTMMNGKIKVESELGKGSTFSVELPFAIDRSTERNIDEHDFSYVHALIVDDEQSACEYMHILMRRCGVNSEYALSGKSAINSIINAAKTGHPFDLCLMDWKMPDMNGVETVKRIREQVGNDLPIIIVTAYDFSEIEESAKASGVSLFISKPLFQSTMFDLLVSIYGNYKISKSEQSDKLYDFSGKRLLLAEDNEMNREIATDILSMYNFKLDATVNGKEALDAFIASPQGTYDAILMDIQMPLMDGYEATKAIRASNHPESKTIPIIAMTANAFSEDIVASHTAGMNDHISKPIDINQMLETLKKHIR